VRPRLLIGFLCLALLFYFALLTRTALALFRTGTPSAIALGLGVLLLPMVGAWAVIATLRSGIAMGRLARQAADEGVDLDVSDLPRMPSGRIRRDAADALFETVRADAEARPDDWRAWYRLARAYDYAGDRARARETMRRAVELESGQHDE